MSRFDGAVWRTFAVGGGHEIVAITQDRSGKLWFAGGYGVTCYDGNAWRSFTKADGLADDYVSAITEDRSGNLWFATMGGVSRFDGLRWTTFTTADGLVSNEVIAIAEDRSGGLWFGTYGGVSRFDGTTWRTFTTADGLASNSVHVIGQDSTGNLWFGFGLDGTGVSRFDGTSWRTFTTADGLSGNTVDAITRDRSGDLWFGTYDHVSCSVSRFDGSRWRTFTNPNGLVACRCRAITEDRSGNLWFGTDQGGATRFDGVDWKMFTVADGLSENSVNAIKEDRSGILWVGTNGGVSRFDGVNWRTFTTADGLADNQVNTIMEDRSGNLWFGTHGGVSRFDGVSWRSFTTADGLVDSDVHAVAEDSLGNYWFGTQPGAGGPYYGGGVSRFDGVSWRTFTTADGLVSNYLNVITVDRSGNVWAGFGDFSYGVSRFDGNSWSTVYTADGLANDWVSSIMEDRSGNLWFGTPGGLSRFDGMGWKTFTTLDGLAGDDVRSITEDHIGNLWFGTLGGGGVSRFDGTTWVTFSVAEGLQSNDVLSNYVAAMTESRSGDLWFGTFSGLARYEPDRVPPRTVFLNRPGLSTSRNLSATFVAAFGETRGIQFSSRLDGGAWSSWAPVGSWTGSDISDGIHTLEARSRDESDNIEVNPATAIFEVDATPPTPIIAAPAFAQPVRGVVDVRGVAADARFRNYRVEVRPAGSPSWDPSSATLLTQSSVPVISGLLASWNTLSFPDGNYELRLSVSDSLGLTGIAQVTVVVDNRPPYADVTAPAKVSAASGGDIFTTNSELHLYFPPHAFAEDALVTITPDATAPDTIGARAVRVLPAYDVSWDPATIRKPAILEFSTSGRLSASGALAIYHSRNGVSWERLGGTLNTRDVSLAIRELGRYALYAETAPVDGSRTMSDLSFTPRVFSISNRFANDHVAIGFTLGRAAPVTVRIYNRAGRLVRDVVEGQVMGPGANLVRWNGTDRANVPVADGIYMVTVQALGETRRSTIAVVR